ncbi:MAG: DUF808 domain-containing protein [Flavobacteriales bacterium]|nr:DUF808 domain-containing protein [Flavobacteriales bacterium]
MASGFFALLDDIAALMDDVAVMGKVATKKTAGILGDDLAVNAEKASGFVSSREIPVLWAITKGSFLNKLIILLIAFGLSAFFPSIIPLILVGGALYLAYEGAEKLYEIFVPHQQEVTTESDLQLSKEEILELEKEKVKSAIITDFILSIEIVIIALGSVLGQTLLSQILVVSFVAIVATIGVYGIVALIVRMDDFGFQLKRMSDKAVIQFIGNTLVKALPLVIKALGYIGTIALLLVAGGIFVHHISFVHHLVEGIPSIIGEFFSGLIVGFISLIFVMIVKKIFKN